MSSKLLGDSVIRKNDLHGLVGEITYVIPVEDGGPYEASLLQGFAPSLMKNAGLIHLINSLPSDIMELSSEGREVRLARRMSGQAPVRWRGQSPKALTSMVIPPFFPFVVLFLGQDHKIDTYREWVEAHSFPLTIVAEKGGTIAYDEFGLDKLKDAFLDICDALEGQVRPDSLVEARDHLNSWNAPDKRDLGYQVAGHNAIIPNLHALRTAGFTHMLDGGFDQINEGISPYIDIIKRTTRSVLEERERIGERQANQYFRRPPSLNLFAPAFYPHFQEVGVADMSISVEEKKRLLAILRILKRQYGYGFEVKTDKEFKALFAAEPGGKPRPHPIMLQRSAELSLASECVGTLSASEVSAVIRLPNAVNRTLGQVRQFAQHYHAKRTTEQKRLREFGKVQNAISASIPKELLELVEGAKDGLRLITDAHLEWITIRGLPLCVQKDVTRIPVTPGNHFVDQILPNQYQHLVVSDFEEILILNALQDDDPISRCFKIAIDGIEPHFKNRIRVRTERVRNLDNFVDTMNSYEGSVLIFDGHGSHEKDNAAMLHLLDEKINIWELQGKRVRVPPIVVLSACDTHAADRNHASTANGFLSIGARTVLGSVFPIDARDASLFVARLLYRVAEFVPVAHKAFNRSLTWMEIMSGMIRMQLLTDLCRRMERKKMIDEETSKKVHLAGNIAINSGTDWPFELVVAELVKLGIEEKVAWHELRSATANSTAISYIQMGRPETLIIHPDLGHRDKAEADSDRNVL